MELAGEWVEGCPWICPPLRSVCRPVCNLVSRVTPALQMNTLVSRSDAERRTATVIHHFPGPRAYLSFVREGARQGAQETAHSSLA